MLMLTFQEAEPIKAMNFHPGGDHMIVATSHPVIRIYDMNTLQCFVCAFPKHQHTQPVRKCLLYCVKTIIKQSDACKSS